MNFTIFGWLNWFIMIASVTKSRMQLISAFLIRRIFSLSNSGFGVLSSSNFTSTLIMFFLGCSVYETIIINDPSVWMQIKITILVKINNCARYRTAYYYNIILTHLNRDPHIHRRAGLFVIPTVYHTKRSFTYGSKNFTNHTLKAFAIKALFEFRLFSSLKITFIDYNTYS